jgi:hypothetical protein
MQISLRRDRYEDYGANNFKVENKSIDVKGYDSTDTFEMPQNDLRERFQQELQGYGSSKPAGQWPLPIDRVLTTEGQKLLSLSEPKKFGAIEVSRGEVLLNGKVEPNGLFMTAGNDPDFSYASFALDESGTKITGFECSPPSSATRWARALVDAGLMKHHAVPELGAHKVDFTGNGAITDRDGNGLVSQGDFEGLVPSTPAGVAESLSQEVHANDARVVLLGERHDLTTETETEALVAALAISGKKPIVAYEVPSAIFGESFDKLNHGRLDDAGADAWRAEYVGIWEGLAKERGVELSPEKLAMIEGRADHLLTINHFGGEVHAIDAEVENRDEWMAANIQMLADSDPNAVVIGLVGMQHAAKTAQPDQSSTKLGADPANPAGKRLQEIFGEDKVISVGFAAFGTDHEVTTSGFDHLYAKGNW